MPRTPDGPVARTEYLRVRITKAMMSSIDKSLRPGEDRSEFVRLAVNEKLDGRRRAK